MVSDQIIAILDPILGSSVSMYGLTIEAIITIFAIFLALVFALRMSVKSEKTKEVGLAVFFSIMIIFVFFGVISWFIVTIPLILISLYFFYTKRGVGSG